MSACEGFYAMTSVDTVAASSARERFQRITQACKASKEASIQGHRITANAARKELADVHFAEMERGTREEF